jgi:hypothetical protein
LTGDLLQFLLATLPWLVGYLFPNGQFVPRWTRWLTFLIVFFAGGGILFPASPLNISNWPGPLGPIVQVMIIGTVLFAQIYRYVRVSTPYQRQQTKWVVFGITAVIIYFIMLFIVGTLNPEFTQANSLGSLFAESTYFLAFIIVPLAIAALFQPLRRRIQKIIDRRFYRRKYDAARILADFSVTLRNEMDLSQLREQLVEVVQETMQPAHVSLWLRKPDQEGKHTTKDF